MGPSGDIFQWNIDLNSNIFIQENVVCKVAAILSRPQSVNSLAPGVPYGIMEIGQYWLG